MLGRRLASAAIIISVMLLLLWLDFWLGVETRLGRPGLILCGFAIVAAGMAATELVHMWRGLKGAPNPKVVIPATVAMAVVSCLPVLWRDYPVDCAIGSFGWGFSGVVLAFVISILSEMYRFNSDEQVAGAVTNRLGHAALVYVYLAMLIGFLVPHRFLQGDNAIGLIALITMICTVKLSDSFAYFFGKGFGTVRMAPNLSPGKTVQGAAGAFIGGCLGTAIVIYAVAPLVFGVSIAKPWWWALLYGLLVTLAGMIGDLAESLIKRDAHCKDSGNWIPGIGGILDVMDSMLFAAPISYFLWIVADSN